jgi:hypothetical protein
MAETEGNYNLYKLYNDNRVVVTNAIKAADPKLNAAEVAIEARELFEKSFHDAANWSCSRYSTDAFLMGGMGGLFASLPLMIYMMPQAPEVYLPAVAVTEGFAALLILPVLWIAGGSSKETAVLMAQTCDNCSKNDAGNDEVFAGAQRSVDKFIVQKTKLAAKTL